MPGELTGAGRGPDTWSSEPGEMVVQILTSDLRSFMVPFHSSVRHSWETLGTGAAAVSRQGRSPCPCAVCV